MNKIKKYLSSRTVWAALIGGVLSIFALLNVDKIGGIPTEGVAENKDVLANQLAALGAAVCNVLAIFFRIHAKAKFD